MAAHPTAATLPRPFSLARIIERVVILAIALAVVLTAYSKMGGEAEKTVAQTNLAAITPFVHAYAVEHGDYRGMTLQSLQEEFGPGLDRIAYTLVERGASDFCIESTYADHTWHMSATPPEPVAGGCQAS